MKLPDLTGKRVLDLGTRDGYFAFTCEQLGADVTAIDNCPPDHTGFPIAKELYQSDVEYRQGNVYDLSGMDLGTFDVVLCLGLLYHLRHPLFALDQIRQVCRGLVYVESLVADHAFFRKRMAPGELGQFDPDLVRIPIAQFLPSDDYHEDWTNRWNPNLACLQAMVEDALFDVVATQTWGDRALVKATISTDPERMARHAVDSSFITGSSSMAERVGSVG
jgi:tRNA (mo5U34)-methyltransferase